MNLKIAMGLLIYWSLIFIFFGDALATADSFGNPFTDAGYTTNTSFNSTFDEGELDPDQGGILGFFDAIAVVFGAIGRFIALILFGVTPVLTGGSQIIFSIWSTLVTIFAIGWIIDSLWSG